MEQDISGRGGNAGSAPVATLCAMFDHAVATAPDKVALSVSVTAAGRPTVVGEATVVITTGGEDGPYTTTGSLPHPEDTA